jgi:hypothetical protein
LHRSSFPSSKGHTAALSARKESASEKVLNAEEKKSRGFQELNSPRLTRWAFLSENCGLDRRPTQLEGRLGEGSLQGDEVKEKLSG